MWGLNNTNNVDIDAPEAWDIERGKSSVTVAVIGVAPNIKIMPLKFLGPNGGYISDAIDAINYAKQNDADIIML